MAHKISDYPEFVSLVIEAFQAANIEYMVGGALALWAWGEPRSTMDLDMNGLSEKAWARSGKNC